MKSTPVPGDWMSLSRGACGNDLFHCSEMSTSASASPRPSASFASLSRKRSTDHGVATLARSVSGRWWISDP
jgi:hypothetical protein